MNKKILMNIDDSINNPLDEIKNSGIICQYLSDRYGTFPGEWMGLIDKPGLKHIWSNKKNKMGKVEPCGTYPGGLDARAENRCQILSDHYGIKAGETWGDTPSGSLIRKGDLWGKWGCRVEKTSPTDLVTLNNPNPTIKCEEIKRRQ